MFVHGKSITQVEAESVYKIRRLASRIDELKKEGWNIKSEIKRDMMGQRYARYKGVKPYASPGTNAEYLMEEIL